MTTVDSLLVKIMDSVEADVLRSLPKKDLKALINLSRSVLNPSFITEKQSRLLIKILSKNSKKFDKFNDEIDLVLKNPSWSNHFRSVDEMKKVYTTTDLEDLSYITIEYHFSPDINQVIKELFGIIRIHESYKNSKKTYRCMLDEKNLVTVIEKLKPLGFEFEDTLLRYYDTIKSWSGPEIYSQFSVDKFDNTNFVKKFIEEIPVEELNETLVLDRSIKYQYFCKFPEKRDKSLTELIASREKIHFWADKKQYGLSDIIKSLIELNRLPVMFVFDSYDHTESLQNLQTLSEILEKNGIFDSVGIYFRMDNKDDGKKFNQLIAEKKYNTQLDDNTKVVGVQNGKIPKFFIKNEWKPKSVVSLCTYLKNSKTAVFAESCDLIVIHSDNEPLGPMRMYRWLSD